MASYEHEQAVAATTWSIPHSFNTDTVIIDVFVDNGGDLEKMIPLNVLHTTDNIVTVLFSSAQSGRAIVIAKD